MTTPREHPAGDRRPGEEATSVPTAAGWSDGSRLLGCDLIESVAAELALGSLTGAERSAAFGHVDDCRSCRRLVEELTATADAVLLIAPEADPPAGFEVRLLERLHAPPRTAHSPAIDGGSLSDGTPPAATGSDRISAPALVSSIDGARARAARRFTTRARGILAIAAVALAAAGVGVGLEVAPRNAPASYTLGSLRLAALRPVSGVASARSGAGEVVLTAGRPSWVLMTVQLKATGWVTCEVDVNGHEVRIGTFQLEHGKGSWAASLGQSGAAVTGARVVDSSGHVLASADFQA